MIRRIRNIARRLGTRPEVGTTPADVVHRENKWRLLRYRNPEPRYETPILLVPSLINRHYVLDLMPGKSFVEYLVREGHDVWIIDWGTPGPEDRYLSFDTICDVYLGRAIRKVAGSSPRGKAHVLGYCLGGTLTTIHAAVRPEHVASLINLAAPIDFHDDGLLSTWSRIMPLDLELLVDTFGVVPWQLMQFGFHLLRPTLTLNKAVYMLDRAWDDEFLDGFFALETWGNDNVSFPGEAFVTYITELYRKNALVHGEFALGGEPVRLENIEAPLLNIAFEHDHIVPVQSAAILNDFVGSKDAELVRLRGGHVGAVVSRKASRTLWPTISTWCKARDHEGSGTLRDVS